MAEALRPLGGPYEIFDLADREVKALRLTAWERGSMVIHPRYPGAPAAKTVEVVRVHVSPEVKAAFPYYYDITSTTLIAQLLPFLMDPRYREFEYVVTKLGVAPRARFTLDRRPL